MAGRVTEVQSHDEGKGGRSVTGVHRSVMGIQNKSVTESIENEWVRKCNGAWLHGLLECMAYFCA